MKVKDIVAFLEENQKDFKVHCGRGSTDTFLPLRLFLQDRTKYMVWQEEQTQKNFQRKYILSLIYWHKDEWIFAGIYESLDVKETPDGPSKYRYTTRLVDVATDLIGKMIVGFKKDFRASYLCLENYIDDLEVLEITRDVCKTVFPGYDKVNVSWEELSGLIETEAWKTALANQKGVYLISDSANGKKYVGSAYGENMILGRWRDYIANGNGGNVELKNIDFKYIQENFRYSILEIFKNTTDDDTILAKLVILAIRQVILDDDIKDETTIGVITKADLRTRDNYDFLDVLTSFLIYACTNTKNKAGAGCIDQITEDFVESFKPMEDEITLNKTTIVASEEIKNTVVPDSFLEAFHEVDVDLSLGLKNNNQLRLFRLACDEGEYSYDTLGEFLLDNIGSYVYSREKRKDLVDRNRAQSVGVRAMHIMMQNGKPGARDVGNDLAQILVYAFLEEALKAPKIMSKVEIVQENGLYKSKSDSIHFLTLEHNGKKVYELVFGAADISLGLKEAVDKAMVTVEAISKDSKKEKGIISGTLLNKTFDAETTNFLKSVLLPSNQNVQRPNMAYGLFLGYSIDINSDVDHFEEDAVAKLEQDVQGIIPYIAQKINELNLADRSFYVYFLPFNDAVKDKITIMKKLLMAGGDE